MAIQARCFPLLTALFALPAFASNDYPAPRIHENSLELKNTATSASYSKIHKQADWVFYPLGEQELQDCYDRTNSFRNDPRLSDDISSKLSDYTGSGYDRGHLSPAGDNKWSEAAMKESFYLSNVSPQPPAFNRGIWSKLEGLVRAWGKTISGGLWVTTGPVLTNSLLTIGEDKVSVPEYFYKVLSNRSNPQHHETIAFLLPTNASGDLSKYEMSVKKLEEITGLDFLAGLSDEDEAEASFHPLLWNTHASFSYFPCKAISPAAHDWAWGLSPQ